MTIPVIGMKMHDAFDLLEANGKKVRLSSFEGKPMLVTADYIPDRYNLSIRDGKVVGVSFG